MANTASDYPSLHKKEVLEGAAEWIQTALGYEAPVGTIQRDSSALHVASAGVPLEVKVRLSSLLVPTEQRSWARARSAALLSKKTACGG
jgi:hypothetical protein